MDVKIVFFLIFDSRNQKFDFFRLSFISRHEKLMTSVCVTHTKFVRAGFSIFVLVSVSHDFELGRNVSYDL